MQVTDLQSCHYFVKGRAFGVIEASEALESFKDAFEIFEEAFETFEEELNVFEEALEALKVLEA